jgi:hypothetical protein
VEHRAALIDLVGVFTTASDNTDAGVEHGVPLSCGEARLHSTQRAIAGAHMRTQAPGTTLAKQTPYGTLRCMLQHSTDVLGSPPEKYTHVQKQRCPLLHDAKHVL